MVKIWFQLNHKTYKAAHLWTKTSMMIRKLAHGVKWIGALHWAGIMHLLSRTYILYDKVSCKTRWLLTCARKSGRNWRWIQLFGDTDYP